MVLLSSNCKEDYKALKGQGVKFTSPPKEEAMVISAVFSDLYGNPYNLSEPKQHKWTIRSSQMHVFFSSTDESLNGF